jgi:hypothetical protein
MRGNQHVQFLGEWRLATVSAYPTPVSYGGKRYERVDSHSYGGLGQG